MPLVVLCRAELVNDVLEHLLDLCSVQVEDKGREKTTLVKFAEHINQSFPISDLPPVSNLLQFTLEVGSRTLRQVHIRELSVLLQRRGTLQGANNLSENGLRDRVAGHQLIELGHQGPLVVSELRLSDGHRLPLPKIRHWGVVLDRRSAQLLLQGGKQLHGLPRGEPQITRHPLLLHAAVGQDGERMKREEGTTGAHVVVQIVPSLAVLHHHCRGRPLLLGDAIKPPLEELCVSHSSRQSQEGALDHLKQMLPLNATLRLSDTMHLIEDDELDPADKLHVLGVLGEHQKFQTVGNSHQHLTLEEIRVVLLKKISLQDTAGSGRVVLRAKSGVDLSTDLVYQCLGGGDVDTDRVVVHSQDFVHGVITNESLPGRRRGHHQAGLVVIDAVQQSNLPSVGLELHSVVLQQIAKTFHVGTVVHELERRFVSQPGPDQFHLLLFLLLVLLLFFLLLLLLVFLVVFLVLLVLLIVLLVVLLVRLLLLRGLLLLLGLCIHSAPR
mmetsp:Transcript_41020/g.89407  ORF Transcript_41020/g.89407 Transcript_41020/m.89407 type:complete len:497 (-) Transcript_41020:764-2254(-)